MAGSLSRREFLLVSLLPAFMGTGGRGQTSAGVLLAPEQATGAGQGQSVDLEASWQECGECRGLGVITCLACDGTGLWTDASENAGLYQRESARASGHCAWCNEWGESLCGHCAGRGVVAARPRRNERAGKGGGEERRTV